MPYQFCDEFDYWNSTRMNSCRITLTTTGDYRVPHPSYTETDAYYTDDKQDAIQTAYRMWTEENQIPILITFDNEATMYV